MMSPGFSVWMSSFCGPAICSACLTAFDTSCSDISCVRVGCGVCTVGAAGGASARGRGGGTCVGGALARALGACVALSARCDGGGAVNDGRFCVEDSRLPLTEKR